ncbi:kinase A anchor protein [Lasiosphaeria miniovina]|uniref:Kinase A anchor protein n=1 Tax=Lasiosphaeria miniovina TaxID=1954250 RepID=A0AA40DM81_9PEZI|nr:kinase A anchor protein [Lasiosphaeria miniovina]KAK0706401.1 kinase A anchor protein [Lasiosphaeria miniovina]
MVPSKAAPTHFLCIPLVTAASRPQLVQSLATFRADVSSPLSFGVPEEAIRPVGTLHLTLGVFSFPKNEGLDRAIELLRSLRPREILASITPPTMLGAKVEEDKTVVAVTTEVADDDKGKAVEATAPQDGAPLTITLRGLGSMQPPAKAAVLYSPPVDRLGTLQAFCEKVRAVFREAELMTEENRPLLLHATIMNTIYVKGKDKKQQRKAGSGGGKKWERLTVDARGILDRYEDHVWMQDVGLSSIAICKMGATKTDVDGVEDEAYEVEAEISF